MIIETVEYNSELGDNPLTEEMKRELSGKSPEEQLDYFKVEDNDYEEDYSYGEKDGERTHGRMVPLIDKMYALTPIVRTLIVSEGIIVGAYFHENGGSRGNPKLLNQWACTYFCVDDDGTGSTCATRYSKLVYTGKQQ